MIQFNSALLCVFIFALSCRAMNCYLPDGGNMNTTVTYQCPTIGSAKSSMCCRSMDPSGASGADRCVPAGTTPGDWLCQNDDGSLWRRGCSTKDWGSPGCVNICGDQTKDYNNNVMAQYEEQVTPCDDGSYCCGPSSVGSSCCSKGNGVWIVDGTTTNVKPPATSTAGGASTVTVTASVSPAGQITASSSIGGGGSSSSTITTSPSGNPTSGNPSATSGSPSASSSPHDVTVATPPSSSSSSTSPSDGAAKSNSNGKVIGGAVGGAVAGVALMAIAELFLFRRMRQKRRDQQDSQHGSDGVNSNNTYTPSGSISSNSSTAAFVARRAPPVVTTSDISAPKPHMGSAGAASPLDVRQDFTAAGRQNWPSNNDNNPVPMREVRPNTPVAELRAEMPTARPTPKITPVPTPAPAPAMGPALGPALRAPEPLVVRRDNNQHHRPSSYYELDSPSSSERQSVSAATASSTTMPPGFTRLGPHRDTFATTSLVTPLNSPPGTGYINMKLQL